jgi:uncharacterized protein YdcH (DUF465 family)
MEKHDLLHEFPQYQEKIHELKVSDAHFRKLFDEYHEIEHQIHRINMGSEIANDKMKVTTFELFEIVVKRLVESAYDEGQKDAIEKCIEQLNVKIN